MDSLQSSTEISNNYFQVINLAYEMMRDPSVFDKFVNAMAELLDSNANTAPIEVALENSAKIAHHHNENPNVDVSKEIGILIVGINKKNIISHAPPEAKEWLGAKFVCSKDGIGWVEKENRPDTIAHAPNFNRQTHLPIAPELQSALSEGAITRLIILHQFKLADNALKALTDLYNLTPTEAKLCKLMAELKTIRECALIHKVKISTIKSHLHSIFKKTGTRNQSSLIRLLTQISAASTIQNFSQRQKVHIEPTWKNTVTSIQTLFTKTRYGTRLAYSKFGDPNGTPVLLFHHGVGSRHHTRDMAEEAKKQNMLIFKLDRPGYGHTDMLPAMSIQRLANIVQDFIKTICKQSVPAIGYGVGGRTLMDMLPYTSDTISAVTIYSFRGVPKYSSSTIMHKLTQLVWRKPLIVKSFLKIMQSNISSVSMARNLRKYYEDSKDDTEALSDINFANERLEEVQLSLTQNCSGTIFDYTNLNQQAHELNHPNYKIPIKFIFGTSDPFNTPEDAQDYLSKLSSCQVLLSENHGQLHFYSEFGVFLKSAFFDVQECSWLSEFKIR